MTQHFQAYVSNLNRVRLIELIDREAMLLRTRAGASFVNLQSAERTAVCGGRRATASKAGLFVPIKH